MISHNSILDDSLVVSGFSNPIIRRFSVWRVFHDYMCKDNTCPIFDFCTSERRNPAYLDGIGCPKKVDCVFVSAINGEEGSLEYVKNHFPAETYNIIIELGIKVGEVYEQAIDDRLHRRKEQIRLWE